MSWRRNTHKGDDYGLRMQNQRPVIDAGSSNDPVLARHRLRGTAETREWMGDVSEGRLK